MVYLSHYVRMIFCILLGIPYPQGYLVFLMSKAEVDDCRVVATEDLKAVAKGFLTVVGHIDDYGILVLETLYYLAHDGVVVECGVVVVGKQHAASLAHLGPIFLVVAFVEILTLGREAVVIVGVLSFQMQDGEAGHVGIIFAVLHHYLVVIPQHSGIVFIQLSVAHVKLRLAQNRVVEEEATAEVIHSLLGLWQELVGDEGNTIACPAEQFGKERVVAPVALVAYGMEREDILEDKAREVIWRDDIGEGYEVALAT